MQRPATRPFISGRPITQAEPTTFSYAPARPFSFTGARKVSEATTSVATKTPVRSPTPLWMVAVYQPGLEHVTTPAPSYDTSAKATDDIVEASLALAEDVVEAGRHASSLAAADVLEHVAQRLRRGEILLPPGASTTNDAAVVSAVLAALLGGRR
jgi:hypothetical protein